jgi:hypothetical protein
MITILRMCVVMNPAIPEVQEVCQDYQYHCKREYPELVLMPFLLGKKEHHSAKENHQRQRTMMMPPKTVNEGKASNAQGDNNHDVLKRNIIDNLDTKKGQTGEK